MEYGFLSVIPPLVTIVLALVLKNVFVSLLIGLFLSSFILTDFNLFAGLNGTFYGLVDTFTSSGNTIVLLSMLLIGALIYMIERTRRHLRLRGHHGQKAGHHQVQAGRRLLHLAPGHRGVHLRLPQLHGNRLRVPAPQRQHARLP